MQPTTLVCGFVYDWRINYFFPLISFLSPNGIIVIRFFFFSRAEKQHHNHHILQLSIRMSVSMETCFCPTADDKKTIIHFEKVDFFFHVKIVALSNEKP